MKLVIQRVSQARVTVDNEVVGDIKKGLLVFLGVGNEDSKKDADYLADKIMTLRVFDDDNGNLNLCAREVDASFLVVSQFTLYGNCDKGRRPSFDRAAEPKLAEELYEYFVERLKKAGCNVAMGKFRAMMKVQLVNEGPVTFILESKP